MINRIERRRKALGALLLPVCRSPPFAPCQQLSPYALEISRRQLVNLITGAAALPAFSRIARAETYPSRPVRIIVGPLVMEVNPSVPATTVPEFIAYAKANPGITNIASAGIGTPGHMASELFQLLTGLDLLDVPYRGGAPALTDLLAGQVHVIFDNLPTSLEYIRAGKLRPLAVTTMTRSDTLPDLPTVAEFVPGYEVSSWFGIGAPRNTPTQVVDKLNAEINAGLAAPQLKARLTDLGSTPLMGSPTDFGKLIVEETEKWGRVIRAANIKPERLIRGLR
jgi:tripartite-type tricarboxylate transporter receptor subunit TctC